MLALLGNIRIRTKLALLIVFTTATLAAVGGLGLWRLYDKMVDSRLAELKVLVEIVTTLSADLEKDVQAGKLSREEALTRFQKAAMAMRYNGGSDYMFAYTMDGITVVAPDPKLLGTNRMNVATNGLYILRDLITGAAPSGEVIYRYDYPRAGQKESSPKLSYAKVYKPWNLLIGTGVYIDDIDAEFRPLAWQAGAVIAVLALVSAALAAFIGWNITRPVRRTADALERLADGETDMEVGGTARKDEIGQMARALARLKSVLGDAFSQSQMINEMPLAVMMADARDGLRISYMNKSGEATMHAVERDLACAAGQIVGRPVEALHPELARAKAVLADPERLPWSTRLTLGSETLQLRASAIRDKQGAYVGPMLAWSVVTNQVRLVDEFESTVKVVVDRVASSASEMEHAAQSMSASAGEATRQSAAVASAVDQASSSVQMVATAAEELAASIGEIGRQVEQSTHIAHRAVDQADHTNELVAGLSRSAQRIGDVLSLITDIAGQTNLLALNATIEAARAGEAGKGFAVVASEVKALAGQTSKATDEIRSQIETIQGATAEAVDAIKDISGTIAQISEISTAIASAVEQQGAATREIAGNVQQTADATQEVSGNIGGVSEAAVQTGAAAGQVLGSAQDLSTQSDVLRKGVEALLRTLRAA